LNTINEFPIGAVFHLAAFGNAKIVRRYFDSYTLYYGPGKDDSVTLSFVYLRARPRVDGDNPQD